MRGDGGRSGFHRAPAGHGLAVVLNASLTDRHRQAAGSEDGHAPVGIAARARAGVGSARGGLPCGASSDQGDASAAPRTAGGFLGWSRCRFGPDRRLILPSRSHDAAQAASVLVRGKTSDGMG